MQAIENLRLILESIHSLLDTKMDVVDIADDGDIAIMIAELTPLELFGEGGCVLTDGNGDILYEIGG
ncbi:MAG: hypothetical protein KBT27_15275 [Prevotellaceae bacterium]|nr:hypothetical protein [Candidatus Faecinaster equi]